MSNETNLGSVDYSALTAPINLAEVAEFEAETSARSTTWMPRRGGRGTSPVLVVLALFFVGVPASFLIIALFFGAFDGWWGSALRYGPACVIFIGLACWFIVPSFQAPRRGFGWEQRYRLSRFAWENGLNFDARDAKPNYPGVMFADLPAIVYNHLTPKTGRFFDIGNVRYGPEGTADFAMSELGHRGFLAVHLGGVLPHIVLDAKANDGLMGGVGVHLAGQPVVSLEGDFNRHFTLRCPVGYERDALYILTPDLMVDLLDESLAFDVELIGAWMFVYAMKPFESTDPALYERLFRIIETVGQRAVRRSTWYRDDRHSSTESLAAKPAGSRMPIGMPRKFFVLLLAFLASLAWIQISGNSGYGFG